MTGRVNDDFEAIIEVDVRFGAVSAHLAVAVDTGFSEYLTLPKDLLLAMGATSEREDRLMLGNGSIALFDIYIVEVLLTGQWQSVKTYASDGDALMGMKLLQGNDLFVRIAPGGEVRILPTTGNGLT
ncbi:hypothetical protein BH11ARM2_BH11ARM2_29720 [soil metagenome]